MNCSIYGTHLFVPANNVGFIMNIPLIEVQNIILDLEYATNFSQKLEARYLCKQAIAFLRKACKNLNITVRINNPALMHICEEDLKIIIEASPDFIRVPSVNTHKQLKEIDKIISFYTKKYNITKHIRMHPMIETPEGAHNIAKIATASVRNHALCLGGEDWVKNLNMKRSESSSELHYIRSLVVMYATKNSLYAIDSVYPWLDNYDGLILDSTTSRDMGFCARALQNPKQIELVNKIYFPTSDQLEHANAILKETEVQVINGQQLFIFQDKIIDPLIYNQALRYIQNI